MRKLLAFLPLIFFWNSLVTQSYVTLDWSYPIYVPHKWADSVFANMTQEEKIGQLFMVAAYSNKNNTHVKDIENLIAKYHIGGLIFMQGGPGRQAILTNRYQELSKIPLLISMDAEWGLSMRLDSVKSFPRFMTLGAVQNDTLIYNMGVEIGKQLRRLGVHVNFSPVIDVNNNAENPVIHTRSFGEDKWDVARKATAMMQGMQNQKVIAVAKHFPGHGDTNVDSHYDLPVIQHSKERLDSVELLPFKHLINKGVGGVMMAHLYIPTLDKTPNLPSSLSPKITTTLLKKEMGFNGLVFSDALNMKAVTKFYSPGDAELKAFIAGNDILLFPENVPKAVNAIKSAIQNRIITQKELDESVKKILYAKYWVGLDKYEAVRVENITHDLNKGSDLVKQKIAEDAITIVKDDKQLIPIRNLRNYKIASVAIGPKSSNAFQQTLSFYAPVTHFQIAKNATLAEFNATRKSLEEYDLVIVSVHEISRLNLRTFGLNDNLIGFVNNISRTQNSIIIPFGTPYVLKNFKYAEALVLAYEDEAVFQKMAAQVLFGGIAAKGRLPVNISTAYNINQGLDRGDILRLRYHVEESGMAFLHMQKRIDSIVYGAIREKAMPGAQVLIAKNGQVIFHKAYGTHTYEDTTPVNLQDLYDLASLTKIAATTIAAMKLYEEGKLKLDQKIRYYIPELKGNDKGNITVRQLLSHQAGLQAWIPFYVSTIVNNRPCDSTYCPQPNGFFSIPVADGLFIHTDYKEVIWDIINESPLEKRPKYVYSDLGMFYMKKIIENITNEPFDFYLNDVFYKPLGLVTLTYNPREKFPLRQIIPTENDNYFRFQLLRGYVHDPAAAMIGGIAGHAGLFSNANDLAIIMQMLVNGGSYGGVEFLKPETIGEFNNTHFRNNRRGLGFDKPETDPSRITPTSKLASPLTFGHSGFTGTCAWADPGNGLVYIFLSNRVYPTQTNNKLVKLGVRSNIHTAAYESFLPELIAGGTSD